MADSPSHRHRKRVASAGLRRLAGVAAFDPRAMPRTSPAERARELAQEARTGETYAEATACPDCALAREDTRDPTALCERHMAEAMGLPGRAR